MKSDLIDIEMTIHHQTEQAVLASDDGDREKAVWLPMSQIEVYEKTATTAEITMPQRFAMEKGLI